MTGEPECAGDKVHWLDWDFALADAIQAIRDHTNKHGHLVWEAEDDGVEVVIQKKIDRVDAAIERATSGKKYKPAPGEYFTSHLKLMPGMEDWPTMEEWYEEQDRMLKAEEDE